MNGPDADRTRRPIPALSSLDMALVQAMHPQLFQQLHRVFGRRRAQAILVGVVLGIVGA